jgi:hypothetical protein
MFEKHGPQWPLRWPLVIFVLSFVIFGVRSASAQDPSVPPVSASIATAVAQQPPPKVAFEYSDAYQTRAKIHKAASLTILPLFAAEGFIGQSLFNNPTDGKKTAHLVVATGIGALFGLNTVTGLPNLIQARKDPQGRGRRLAHGLLMLAADGGFFATALTGPGDDRDEGGSRSMHRAIAFTSIGMATAGYLIMLIGGK